MTTNLKKSVLIVDDEKDMCKMIALLLEQEGYTTLTANDGYSGIEVFNKKIPEVVILDLFMPEMDGMEVLKRIKQISNDTPVIIITAHGDVRSAVNAIKLGAYSYFQKPFYNEEIVLTVNKAIEEKMLRREFRILKAKLGHSTSLFEKMGSSDEVKKLNEQVECVAPTNFTVVIYGETGSGKELVAKNIHERSERKYGAFVAVDCGSIPENLIESELFGYEKGAFTSANQTKAGQFEYASGGTLFLDEIGNIPLSMQAKLLRVLQERTFRRLGSNKETEIDLRVIAAGNERLESMVEFGRFRMDLYQRLNEFCIEIPPLRQRKEDILYLCKSFLDSTNKELNKEVHGFTEETLEKMLSYDWPGNVRELKNIVRRGVLLANDSIEPKHIAINMQKERLNNDDGAHRAADDSGRQVKGHGDCMEISIHYQKNASLQDAVTTGVKRIEKTMILEALKCAGGNKTRASKILQVDYKTLYSKIKKYGISIKTSAEVTH